MCISFFPSPPLRSRSAVCGPFIFAVTLVVSNSLRPRVLLLLSHFKLHTRYILLVCCADWACLSYSVRGQGICTTNNKYIIGCNISNFSCVVLRFPHGVCLCRITHDSARTSMMSTGRTNGQCGDHAHKHTHTNVLPRQKGWLVLGFDFEGAREYPEITPG